MELENIPAPLKTVLKRIDEDNCGFVEIEDVLNCTPQEAAEIIERLMDLGWVTEHSLFPIMKWYKLTEDGEYVLKTGKAFVRYAKKPSAPKWKS